jgi:hypothetical protein
MILRKARRMAVSLLMPLIISLHNAETSPNAYCEILAFVPSFGPETAERKRSSKHDNFHWNTR